MESKIAALDAASLAHHIKERIFGQDSAIEAISLQITAHAADETRSKPLVILLSGRSLEEKKQLTQAFRDALFGPDGEAWINLADQLDGQKTRELLPGGRVTASRDAMPRRIQLVNGIEEMPWQGKVTLGRSLSHYDVTNDEIGDESSIRHTIFLVPTLVDKKSDLQSVWPEELVSVIDAVVSVQPVDHSNFCMVLSNRLIKMIRSEELVPVNIEQEFLAHALQRVDQNNGDFIGVLHYIVNRFAVSLASAILLKAHRVSVVVGDVGDQQGLIGLRLENWPVDGSAQYLLI